MFCAEESREIIRCSNITVIERHNGAAFEELINVMIILRNCVQDIFECVIALFLFVKFTQTFNNNASPNIRNSLI